MHLVILGRGKTGTVAAQVARDRKHEVRVLGASGNPNGTALSPEKLGDIDVVIDLTTPHAVVRNMHACIQARKSMVVGTTGWYGELPSIRTLAKACRKTLGSTPGLTRAGRLAGWRFS